MSFPLGKDWWKSKTLWIAIIQFAVGGLLALEAGNPELATVGWIAMSKSVLDMILRFLTTEPVR